MAYVFVLYIELFILWLYFFRLKALCISLRVQSESLQGNVLFLFFPVFQVTLGLLVQLVLQSMVTDPLFSSALTPTNSLLDLNLNMNLN